MCPICSKSKQPFVIITFSPRALARSKHFANSSSLTTPNSASRCVCISRLSSRTDTVEVPTLPTTIPAAKLASIIASRSAKSIARPSAITAITVSPAPVTSKTSFACAGNECVELISIKLIPASPRVSSKLSMVCCANKSRPFCINVNSS